MRRPHERLKAWQGSAGLVTELYEVTGGFPLEERYGLTSQIRRAAVSVPANIAEGAARGRMRKEAMKKLEGMIRRRRFSITSAPPVRRFIASRSIAIRFIAFRVSLNRVSLNRYSPNRLSPNRVSRLSPSQGLLP